MVTILMIATKITATGLFKIEVFWSKGYDVITYAHDVIKKMLLWHSKIYCRYGYVTKVW